MLWCLSAERAVAPLAKCGLRIRASFQGIPCGWGQLRESGAML